MKTYSFTIRGTSVEISALADRRIVAAIAYVPSLDTWLDCTDYIQENMQDFATEIEDCLNHEIEQFELALLENRSELNSEFDEWEIA